MYGNGNHKSLTPVNIIIPALFAAGYCPVFYICLPAILAQLARAIDS
jgi:hypothetical protein